MQINKIRISGIIQESIVDGPGIRFVVFTQGCCHNCEGCHNPHTHDINGGYEILIEDIIAKMSTNPLIDGITISGGEPFLQEEAVLRLVERIKHFGYNIVVYTGYTIEELLQKCKNKDVIRKILSNIDILIDGKFEKDKLDYNLRFRGSSNQRMINPKSSLKYNKAIEIL